MTAPVAYEDALDGAAVRDAFAVAARHLRDSAKAIDAINVYPVPDGDTGSNMAATLNEAVEHTLALDDAASVTDVLQALARGALYGGRGNSGVILSQAVRGFADGVGTAHRLDGAAFVRGLQRAAEQAYRAVGRPQEGTMLTVLREAASAAVATAVEAASSGRPPTLVVALRSALDAAERAEAATIEQLPALKEAGVPDAGGEGVCVILHGLLGAITGTAPAVRTHPAERTVALSPDHAHGGFGFCTEFLVEPRDGLLDRSAVTALASAPGNQSVVVVGDGSLLRVHVHTAHPHGLLDSAERLGRLSRVKIEDMSAQNARYREHGSGAGVKTGLLALSRGAGFDAIFEGLGAQVSDLGVVEKPAAGHIAGAADALGVPDVVVLANHKNVLLAAEQARSLSRATLHIVPTTTLPQGVAAAMAFNPSETPAANVTTMVAAAASIRTVEVTVASAHRTSDGIAVRAGQAIVLLDGVLQAAVDTPIAALVFGLERAGPAKGSLVTLYGGEGMPDDTLQAATDEIARRFPGSTLEVVSGGQPLYPFVASVE